MSTDNMLSLTSLNVSNATAALEQGVAAIRAGQTVFDLRNVQSVDSAAVSVMLAWQRAAHEAGVKLDLQHLPSNLKSLTALYGVCSLVSSSLTDPVCTQAAEPGVAAATAAADLHHH